MSKNPHIGSSFDNFLAEEGLLEEVEAIALKRVIAWQIKEAMKVKDLTKTDIAKAMKTSLRSVNQLLDPDNTAITLLTIERAATAVGMKLKIELVDQSEIHQ